LAVGSVNHHNLKEFLTIELKMGLALSVILSIAGCLRAAIFLTPITETIAITTSLFFIVFISIIFGAVLPLLMNRVNIDPAHSSTTIQVIMDILGVTITVCKSGIVGDNHFSLFVCCLCLGFCLFVMVERVERLTLFPLLFSSLKQTCAVQFSTRRSTPGY
jgi:hypothetical protein